MSFGLYPIPPPDMSTLAQIFGPSVAEEMGPPQPPGSAGFGQGSNPRTPRTPRSPAITPGGVHIQAKPMAIFELLEYIVNQSPPKLPIRIFSESMRDFVERCLKKNPKERPDLQTLSVSDIIFFAMQKKITLLNSANLYVIYHVFDMYFRLIHGCKVLK